MDRRSFLSKAAIGTVGAVAGSAATAALEQRHTDLTVSESGHAVGADRPSGLTTTTINYRVPTSERVIALTIDDGPSSRYTSQVLDILEEKDVSATFFLIGRHAERYPELVTRAATRHEIGNHTWSHPNMGLYHAPDVDNELRRAETVITDITNKRPALFRPPYGDFSGATAMVATSLGYPIMLWDIEFDQHGESTANNVDRLTSRAQPGTIILGHDGGTLNCTVVVEGLPTLIDNLRARGFRFVTVSELLALQQPNSPAAVST